MSPPQVPVPRFAVGIVIGRNGETIKMIQSDTGVRIQFKQDDGTTPERIAQIMGPPEQAQHAADIISDLLRSVQAGGPPGHGGGRGRGRGQGNWNMGPPGGLQEFTFTVPTMKTGLIIGKGEDPRCSLAVGRGSGFVSRDVAVSFWCLCCGTNRPSSRLQGARR